MVAVSETSKAPGGSGILDRYGLLQAGLWSLRAGPALILVLLILVVGLTTPVFLTTRNLGNVFSQTSVIAVLALGQLLVIVTRGSTSPSARRSRSRASSGRSSTRTRARACS